MYVCLYVYVHVCPFVCTCTCMSVCMYMYMYVHLYVYQFQILCIHTHIFSQRCSKEGSELTNTQTLFPILVSSGLDRSVLRDMWSLVNKTIPGTLSRLELYALLGMIGLVQVSV